ncbi:3-methyladenine DNA glycosylase [Gordonia sp. NB41Y]|uniref:3-methyladenine DNA glycosylase n=1 Tax=Gordonia sp. NB41Y TaxID=875808 RepID=UPI0021C63BEB|nr:3-methyladenine DNA glycosylase [Gordonia sp. NB41Y]WLP90640.1 3-methyladenine DNA glycosylase [Gordonia sp. NB41Y]
MTTTRPAGPAPMVLDVDDWTARRAVHTDRVEQLIGPYLQARRTGARHPVLDFLFTYYSSRPSHIRRWHPGFGVVLTGPDADTADFLRTRGYRRTDPGAADAGVTVDPAFLASRSRALATTAALLSATAGRAPRLGCFGLHEWAMVYHADETRHDLPLRLGAAGTDAVVESMPLRCTHFDAFRFFTDDARPRNELNLTPADRLRRDQPGCLHATMDLYRACFTLTPLLDASLTLDAFELARDARDLDMRASPYDLRNLGYEPVPVETSAGRARYVREQSALTERGTRLRAEILHRITQLTAAVPDPPAH